jgi:hypothetical protein
MRQEVVAWEGFGDLDSCGAPVAVPPPVERCSEEDGEIVDDVPNLSEQLSTVRPCGFGHVDHGPLGAANRAAGASLVVAPENPIESKDLL